MISQLYTSPVRPSLIFTVSTVVATVAPYHRASNRNTCGAAPGEPIGRAENKGSDIGAWRLHWGGCLHQAYCSEKHWDGASLIQTES